MEIPVSQFRRELFAVVTKAIHGEPVTITHKGNKLQLTAGTVDRLSRITPMQVLSSEVGEDAEAQLKADIQAGWEQDLSLL